MNPFEFVIKPSNYISPLCYSIFRLEPFDTCSFGCIYCYAQWYRGPHKPKPRAKWYVVKEFERIVKRLSVKPYFRLATLSEPFQDDYEITLKLIRIAKKHKVPLIINTKSDKVSNPDIIYELASLASDSLVLVQISISSLKYDKILEPLAPSARSRLKAVEALSSMGVPTVVRVQPLIPGLEEDHYEVADLALRAGAQGLIGESIRLTEPLLKVLYSALGLRANDEWEPYQFREVEGKEPLLHPKAEWRERVHRALSAIASTYNKPYADCKETCTFYGFKKDCCLSWVAMNAPLRLTLREYLNLGLDCENYLCDMEGPLGRVIRMHIKKMIKVASDERLLKKICPFIIEHKAVPNTYKVLR